MFTTKTWQRIYDDGTLSITIAIPDDDDDTAIDYDGGEPVGFDGCAMGTTGKKEIKP